MLKALLSPTKLNEKVWIISVNTLSLFHFYHFYLILYLKSWSLCFAYLHFVCAGSVGGHIRRCWHHHRQLDGRTWLCKPTSATLRLQQVFIPQPVNNSRVLFFLTNNCYKNTDWIQSDKHISSRSNMHAYINHLVLCSLIWSRKQTHSRGGPRGVLRVLHPPPFLASLRWTILVIKIKCSFLLITK